MAQLSEKADPSGSRGRHGACDAFISGRPYPRLAEREGFEPSIRVDPVYRISRPPRGVVKGGTQGHSVFGGCLD